MNIAIGIVDLPINSMMIFHRYVNVYQRVSMNDHEWYFLVNIKLAVVINLMPGDVRATSHPCTRKWPRKKKLRNPATKAVPKVNDG